MKNDYAKFTSNLNECRKRAQQVIGKLVWGEKISFWALAEKV